PTRARTSSSGSPLSSNRRRRGPGASRASMAERVTTKDHRYEIDGTTFDGAVVVDTDRAGSRPAVLVFHGGEGRSAAPADCARALARLGYVGFACDMFGGGIRGDLAGDNSALIAPFLRDRAMLRGRLAGTVKVVRSLPGVEPNKLAAIGFCFGGLCVLDL